jgi:hypothetical protein
MSLNQKDIELTNKNKAKYTKIYALEKLCIDKAVLVVNENRDILVYKGQGEGDTKWKGWCWKILLVISVIKKKFFLFLFIVGLQKCIFYLSAPT